MIHLVNALLLLGVLVYIAWVSSTTGAGRVSVASDRRLQRLALGAAATTYVLALSGALVVERGAGAACAVSS